jgi:hypothetical protein
MADIIKTWPAGTDPKSVAGIFSRIPRWARYYFTLGRGKPKLAIDRLWWTYQGRIIGSFKVDCIVVNDGSLPLLRSLEGKESAWQIKPDAYVAICSEPCQRLKERIFMSGFRGWHYFNLAEYRVTPDSRLR